MYSVFSLVGRQLEYVVKKKNGTKFYLLHVFAPLVGSFVAVVNSWTLALSDLWTIRVQVDIRSHPRCLRVTRI
jgi:hypothetical protein